MKVNNLNYVKACENPKMKLYRKSIAAVLSFSIAAGAVGALIGRKTIKEEPVVLQDGYKIVNVDINVSNDTLDEIVEDYYKTSYNTVYHTEKDYKKTIMAQNDLDDKGNIEKTQISIPVIIEENNQYYEEIKRLEEEIKYIEENKLWIEHIVENGDSIYGLASYAGITEAETMEIMQKILNKNHLKQTSILNVGDAIYIMNTSLGEKKQALEEAKTKLYESLKANNEILEDSKTK